MIERKNVPYAPILIESMRSIGYSFDTAIADIVDNSVSAQANRIDIILSLMNNPYIIIFDNGCGMNKKEIINAMRYGSMDPLLDRNENDLGRFGLGLKSASLSQCRELVVVSKKVNNLSAFSWNLNKIKETGDWTLLEYSKSDMKKLPKMDLFDNVKSGTYVLLKCFDRISESTNDLGKTLTKNMNTTKNHLALVFHRFLEDELEIYINNNKVEAVDPFLKRHHATQKGREQKIKIHGKSIIVKPYSLPHANKLSKDDLIKIGGKEDLKNNQGFYIYRNRRLIIWGTWFRLHSREELTKFARVQVDIPSSLDDMWNIDIKKSSATLPDIIKRNLYNCIFDSTGRSKKIIEYRGKRTSKDDQIYIWERLEMRNKEGFNYKINREILPIAILSNELNKNQLIMLENILNCIEDNLPTQMLYLDISKGNEINTFCKEDEKMYTKLIDIIEIALDSGWKLEEICKVLKNTEPFVNNKYIWGKIEGDYGGKTKK